MTGIVLGLALGLMLLGGLWWALGGWVVVAFYAATTAGMASWYATSEWRR